VRDYIVAIVLGVTDGITELIPVSASAHLRIAEILLRVRLSGAFLKLQLIVVHLGTVTGVLVLYARQLRAEARMPESSTRSGQSLVAHSPLTIGLAFLVASLCRDSLDHLTSRAGTGLSVLAASLIAGGGILWGIDVFAGRKAVRKRATAAGAVWVGVCESLSGMFPGLSRSLLTIVAGEIAGMARQSAVEFSILLFVPGMLTELISEMRSISRSGTVLSVGGAHGLAVLAMGFCTSAAGAYVSANWMLKRSERHSLASLGLYRICLGFVLIVWLIR